MTKHRVRVEKTLCTEQIKELHVKPLFINFSNVKGAGEVSWKLLNLASLESIEKCCNSILVDESRIDLLVLNAGSCKQITKSGCSIYSSN